MTVNTYDIGDLVKISATFTDENGTATDPTTLEAAFKSPSGTISTFTYGTDPEVVRDSAGVYHLDISITESGRYDYRWSSTGTGQAAEEGYFEVRQQRVA